ncbi:hypothetical protein HPB48_021882 [Haemaphysalis longicornis]|uniref:Uncharacterized protein n=1 Tax=Haemaphysalis longicornis TaxID=44386 RepID=A0A9J6GTR6_HAELO|nr:hypothetical protein HPB48_021882 [Haemaphysalis longicornis]
MQVDERERNEKECRGTLDSCVASCGEQDMVVVKRFDNTPVALISNCVGVEATTTVKRWDKSQRIHVPIECPAVGPEYTSMGGVDLLDKMRNSYRFPMRAKRWYLYIFWHTAKWQQSMHVFCACTTERQW